jgi:hypothetical protein
MRSLSQSPLLPSYLARSSKDSRSFSSPRCQVSDLAIIVPIYDAPRRTPALWRARALLVCSSRNTRLSTRKTYLHQAQSIIHLGDHRPCGSTQGNHFPQTSTKLTTCFTVHMSCLRFFFFMLGAETWHKVESMRCVLFRSPTTLVKQNSTNILPTAHNPAHVSIKRKCYPPIAFDKRLCFVKITRQ